MPLAERPWIPGGCALGSRSTPRSATARGVTLAKALDRLPTHATKWVYLRSCLASPGASLVVLLGRFPL
jgi:hypothetical protein